MDIKILKFGGTALANPINQKKVIEIIKSKSPKRIIICSAMGRLGYEYSTDSLSKLVDGPITLKEKDRLLACGETISSIRLSSLLNNDNCPCIALSINEMGFICDNNYGNGNIINISNDKIISLLNTYDTLIIPGYIAMSKENEVITLGRGNSDLSAIIAAIALNQTEVILYKDIDGVYHTSPNQYQQFLKYKNISFDEMIALSKIGFEIVSYRALVEAKKHNITIIIKSFLNDDDGTIISLIPSNDICLGFNFIDKYVLLGTFKAQQVKNEIEKVFNEKHIFIKNEIIECDYLKFEISKSVKTLAKKIILKYFIDKINNF